MFDYKLIEALAAVTREKGFEKAARALHITQSAVSQRIKLLEDQTGQVLLARTTPPKTTSAGKKLLKHYLKVKQLEDDLADEMHKPAIKSFSSISIGINTDSLETWFPDAVRPFLLEEKVLLDIRVDDQEQTHRMLKDGVVSGCISTMEKPIQGCCISYLGCMNYRMMATPEFAERWFSKGLTIEDISRAPAIMFNRKDELHYKLLRQSLGKVPTLIPTHYVPSVEKFLDFITAGISYGMLPDKQSAPLILSGCLINLAPENHVPVKLYWHCWNLKSNLLKSISQHLVRGTKNLLKK
ncbi:MAG: LysR family transcriptional regulator ArgP [Desulfobacterales bacterium]|nr:LysR family transcriptional regulator ArgP [Desulfobacterales bacterium]